MTRRLYRVLAALTLGSMLTLAVASPAAAADGGLSNNSTAITLFLLIVAGSIGVTLLAARSTKSTSDFLAASGKITPFQNGLALAGDFMSAGAFLGLSALIFNSGFDGLIYAIGYIASWPIVMFLIADPLRNLGRYTMADALSHRFDERKVRPLIAVISLVLVIFYLIAQMVGAGQVIQLMFGLNYTVAVSIVGALMIFCVMIGGMIATTWVQMIKAVLLLFTGVLVAFLVWRAFGYDFSALIQKAVSSHPKSSAILSSQMLPKDPVSGISLGMALIFGTAGLPHILMRFFTVKDGRDARLSAVWATSFIGFFFLLLFPIGFGAIALVTNDPTYHQANGALIGGANTVSIHLSHAVGGDFLMAFVCAVAFATIVAVVAGLTLAGASTIAHDLLKTTDIDHDGANKRGLLVMRIVTLILGIVATGLAVAFRDQNVAYMLGLAFALAASANFPILLLAIYWSGLTTIGIIVGGCVGLTLSVLMTILGPAVWVKVFGFSSAIVTLDPPTLVTMPITFLACWAASILDRSRNATKERAQFAAQYGKSAAQSGA
ncbi:cation/acetate symporter [Bradyrhizobium sp. USDA 4461]